jgi:protein-disulfide isomerase
VSGDDLDAAVRAGRRGQLVGGIFFLAVIVVGALVASGAFGGGGDPARNASYVDGVRGVRETTTLLQGVEQEGIRLGRADAPATIVVFADLKCSACRGFALGDQKDVVADLVRTGKANLELRLIGLQGFRPDNLTGRTAAYALAEQDRMWPLVELLYWNQGEEADRWIDEPLLRKLAAASPELRGIVPSTRPTAGSRRLSAEADALQARLEVATTPRFFVRPRGADPTQQASYAPVDGGGLLGRSVGPEQLGDAVAKATGR